MEKKIEKLLKLAKKMMEGSQDPIHDIGHVKRVVAHCENISKSYLLSEKQKQSLILAAWWHDVSRVNAKHTSFFIMPFIDDTLSAFVLWFWTIRYGLFGSIAGMSTRIIFCKSHGTGTILSRILLRKKNRVLIDILKDADMLDIFSVERTEAMRILVDSSKFYKLAYKILMRWFFVSRKIQVKTTSAKKIFLKLLEQFLEWATKKEIYMWHLTFSSKKWMDSHIEKVKKRISIIKLQYI